jgi:hypothetical protein
MSYRTRATIVGEVHNSSLSRRKSRQMFRGEPSAFHLFFQASPFQMETFEIPCQVVNPGDYLTSIDQCDPFFLHRSLALKQPFPDFQIGEKYFIQLKVIMLPCI